MAEPGPALEFGVMGHPTVCRQCSFGVWDVWGCAVHGEGSESSLAPISAPFISWWDEELNEHVR